MINEQYERFLRLPFPKLGKTVGDFALYEGLIAGTAQSFLQGCVVDARDIPPPDAETVAVVARLRSKEPKDEDEVEFCNYYEAIEHLRDALLKAVKSRVG